ncbi:hypothetical protein MCHI_000303 [Candidatus Magnetoovum chiemensis]|nr:hypothetical protein MCHI_000303 [Candidatus Magnetoovum chiemensis]
MQILKLLDKCDIVISYDIIDFKRWENGFYYKAKIALKDKCLLYAKEYVDQKERVYSFHWQDKRGNLIIRWDNSPHHKRIATFPHHKHVGDEVTENILITLEDVLEYIKHAV